MVEALVLKAERRESSGSRVARRERASGLVPAIIYGHKQDPVGVVLNYHDLALELQHGHRLLSVELDGKREGFLVKEVQYDYLGDTIMHVDLTRVDMNERVQVMVELSFKGTPKGVHDGGNMDQLLNEVELDCVVTNIPEFIKVNVTSLELGGILKAGDLELPDGTKLVTEAEIPVAMIRVVSEEPEAEEEAEETETAEPEVITREKSEGSEEAGE